MHDCPPHVSTRWDHAHQVFWRPNADSRLVSHFLQFCNQIGFFFKSMPYIFNLSAPVLLKMMMLQSNVKFSRNKKRNNAYILLIPWLFVGAWIFIIFGLTFPGRRCFQYNTNNVPTQTLFLCCCLSYSCSLHWWVLLSQSSPDAEAPILMLSLDHHHIVVLSLANVIVSYHFGFGARGT